MSYNALTSNQTVARVNVNQSINHSLKQYVRTGRKGIGDIKGRVQWQKIEEYF